MTSAELIPAVILKRKAVVYVRQSTQSQVMTNLESKRRQYDLVDVARQCGFVDVEIIDDDLGRSASGTVARPGFDRLVAWLCAGKVGAVLCFDASRLAEIGITCSNYADLSKPASSISTASTIPVDPMIACCWA
jgi:DNA invertase Pin-like site-specific DNA recombinase